MIKKLFKFIFISGIVLLVLGACAGFVLYKMYPPARLKSMAQEYVAKKLQRQLSFEDLSFTWIGFTLTKVALSENTDFEQGTFIKADKLTAHVAVKPLFKKRIEIDKIEADGLQLNIVQHKDGSFNFDTLLPAQTTENPVQTPAAEEQTESEPLVLTAKTLSLRDCDISYKNEQTGFDAAVQDLNIDVQNFDLADPFAVMISFTTQLAGWGQTAQTLTVPVRISSTIFLANLDMSKAYANITQLAADYQTLQLALSGEIKNFKAPSVEIAGTLNGITNRVFSAFAPDLPNFNLPPAHLTVKAQADLETSTANITQARLAVEDSFLALDGNVDWGRPVPAYQLAASLKANLGQIVKMTDTLDGFSPVGVISGNFRATEKKDNADVSGKLVLQNVSAFYEPVTLTQTNGTIVFASLTDISSSSLTGKLNEQPFTMSFSYKDRKQFSDLALTLDLEKLVLKNFSASRTQSAPSDTAAATEPETQSVPMNISAQVNIGGIEIPYLQADGFNLTADLSGVTEDMSGANGTVGFSLKPGKITNLDTFIKDNKIAKIILLPVAVVKKVSGLLKLNLFPADESGLGAKISFTQAEGQYTFTDGVMNLDKTVFNSSVTKIAASGTADFKTQQLNMKAVATLLTEAAPVAIKITGTLNDPKGKVDVVNTVTSVVGGILNGTAVKSVAKTGALGTKETAQITTDTVKKTVNTAADVVKGIGGLFKKKKSEPETEQGTDPS